MDSLSCFSLSLILGWRGRRRRRGKASGGLHVDGGVGDVGWVRVGGGHDECLVFGLLARASSDKGILGELVLCLAG